jgi:hypothetical protein
LEPTIFAKASSGWTGFIKAALGLRAGAFAGAFLAVGMGR